MKKQRKYWKDLLMVVFSVMLMATGAESGEGAIDEPHPQVQEYPNRDNSRANLDWVRWYVLSLQD